MVEVSPLIGRTSRISAAAFTGRAVAPAQPDPVTTGLINKNSLQLAVVSNQIQGMTAQMNSLAGSLQVIASNLGTAQALERQKENQEQALEQRLAQQQLREGKESIVEKKIQAAAIAPAQKLAGAAQFTLSRLNSFFMSLLGGWLLTKGVETIKALSEGNTKKLVEIKNHVLATLGVLTAVFLGGRAGILLLARSFSRIGVRILAVSAAGLFAKPFLQLIDIVKKVAVGQLQKIPFIGQKLLGGGSGDNKEDDTLKGVDSTKTAAEQGLTNQIPASNNQSNLEGKGGPSLVSPTETMMGEKVNPQVQELKNERAAIRQDYFSGRIDNKSTTADLDKQINQFESANKTTELDPNTSPQYGKTSLKAEVVMGFSGDKSESFVGTEKYTEKFAKLPSNMFTAVKKDVDVAKRVGPEPEKQINVVPIPMETQQSSSQQQSQPAATGGINNAPSFATSNSDNIYTLGAMSNFNVVMA